MRSSLMAFAIVACFVAAGAPRFVQELNAPRGAPVARAAVRPAASTSADNSSNMTIRRSDDGHFHVAADVDGRRMDFLIDTGATSIALRESDAARLGIHPSRRDYTGRTSTANGIVAVAPIELNRVDVGSLTVRNVRAVIFPDEVLDQNLLGMSFLSRVRWEHRDGYLVLEQ